jgi:hypothetical protein
MPTTIDQVRVWWLLDGVGHALAGECNCGPDCPGRYQALCSLRGNAGELVDSVPARICTVCRDGLARVEMTDPYTAMEMRTWTKVAATVVAVDPGSPLFELIKGVFGGGRPKN